MKKTRLSFLSDYLERGSGPFRLELTFREDQGPAGAHPYSIVVLSESDPLSRAIKGRIATDADSTVKDVVFLVQRDKYGIADDTLCTITNPDVERAWQEAFSSSLKEGREDRLLFSRQMDHEGSLIPMSPLFFCNRTNNFLPILCPACGLPLEQCENDELLVLAGLRPYSGSLRRYLHCESCSAQGKLQFYAYETDRLDPPEVEDRFALIRSLASLVYSPDKKTGLLCSACELKDECYGMEQKALLSLVPLAFYPFYMMMIAGFSLNLRNGEQRESKEDRLAASEHALRLGWSLLEAVKRERKEQMPAPDVPEKMELLRDSVKEAALSGDDNTMSQVPSVTKGEAFGDEVPRNVLTNDAIRRVLGEIGGDWRDRPVEPAPQPVSSEPDDDMEESVETVFLTVADLEGGSLASGPERTDEALETVMQSPAGRGPVDGTDKAPFPSSPSAEREMDLEKTVILTVGHQAGTTTVPPPPAPEVFPEKEMPPTSPQANLEETVIISAGYGAAGSTAGAGGPGTEPEPEVPKDEAPKPPAKKVEGDDMEATVILRIDERSKMKGNR